MKRLRGGVNVWAIVSVVALAFIGLVVFLVIDDNNKAVDYSKYDFNTIIGPSADNGNIGDHVKGDADAPTLIFEYADYQCPGCASINPRVNKAVEESDGKLAIVYRSFLLPYHQNGTAAASAVEAAEQAAVLLSTATRQLLQQVQIPGQVSEAEMEDQPTI